MAAVTFYELTGTNSLDAMMCGSFWTDNNITFSFPTDSSDYLDPYGSNEPAGFTELGSAMKDGVRAALDHIAERVDVTFEEVAAGDGVLRYAMSSNSFGPAWAYAPAVTLRAGDVWFRTSTFNGVTPARGNYEWATILHETCHAIGFKHPHELGLTFPGNDFIPVLPEDEDGLESTIMSYRSFLGAGTQETPPASFTNETWGYPHTLMPLDLAALIYLYGANTTFFSGNTIHRFDPDTGAYETSTDNGENWTTQWTPGANRIFMTVYDAGGADAFDPTNYDPEWTPNTTIGGWATPASGQRAELSSGVFPTGCVTTYSQIEHSSIPANTGKVRLGGLRI